MHRAPLHIYIYIYSRHYRARPTESGFRPVESGFRPARTTLTIFIEAPSMVPGSFTRLAGRCKFIYLFNLFIIIIAYAGVRRHSDCAVGPGQGHRPGQVAREHQAAGCRLARGLWLRVARHPGGV